MVLFMKYIKPDKKFKKVNDLSKSEAREEAKKLRKTINHHNKLYYIKNDPEISDEAYDRLLSRLEALENEYPDIKTKDSPTQKVGETPEGDFKKRKHSKKMFSLKSTNKAKEVEKFINDINKKTKNKSEFSVEPKFDGLSVELVYEDYQLKYGLTRGDGKKGEDITHNIKRIQSVPTKIKGKNKPKFLSIRGEVLMSFDSFKKINKRNVEKNEKEFANPRNAISGMMRKSKGYPADVKGIELFAYEILKIKGTSFKKHSEILKKLKEWGLSVNKKHHHYKNFKAIKKFHQNLKNERDDLDYEIDGIVVKIDDLSLRDELGERSRNPRWAIAWKFKPKHEETIIEDIVIQVGRTGILTPVALLRPVDIGGVTVSRATLHNEKEVKRKDLRVGDKVKIIRAGDVIPEVKKRIQQKGKKRKKAFSMPKKCPVCKTTVIKEGSYYKCPAHLKCKAQIIAQISHFASSEAMNINHLGPKTVKQLVKTNTIKNVADLYKLKISDIKKLDGFSSKSAKKLRTSIQDKKKSDLATFLYALGIPSVGKHIAYVIADEFDDLKHLKSAKKKDLKKIKEIGSETAESIYHFFQQKNNNRVIGNLKRNSFKIKSFKSSKKLKGKIFVFTGKLKNYTRSEAKKAVERLGAETAGHVSDNTDYIVVGENPGSKKKEAKNKKTKMIDEKKFKQLINA